MRTRSSKNNNNGGEDGQQPQLQRSERKHKLNQLANDGKPAQGEEYQQEQEECSNKNSRCDGRNDQQDLEVTFNNKKKQELSVVGRRDKLQSGHFDENKN
jgi:hypothetical protein